MSTEREASQRSGAQPGDPTFERRASELLVESAEHLDGRVRSRLTQARHAALTELAERRSRSFRVPGFWVPLGTVAAATVLALAIWLRTPTPAAVTAAVSGTEVSTVEDIAILAAADEPELYADDAEFYEWAGAAAEGALGQLGG